MTDDRKLFEELVSRIGVDEARQLLGEVGRNEGETLTIVSNGGLHRVPPEYENGEIYYASEGTFDLETVEQVNALLDAILIPLKEKLLSRKWKRIYLVPFGPAVISMAIKLAVFRILWMDTVDLFYFGNGEYGAIDRDSRKALFEDAARPGLR